MEASVGLGGCGARNRVYEALFQPGEVGPAPPRLGPGRYGFGARAVDASCLVVAEGCVDVTLPRAEPTVITLLDERTPLRLCAASSCRGGLCEPAGSGGAADAGRLVTRDAAVAGGPGRDAGPAAMQGVDASVFADYATSNIPPSLRTAGGGDLVLATARGDARVHTDTGEVFRADGRPVVSAGFRYQRVTQPGGPPLGVFSLRGLTIEEGVTLKASGTAALVLAASGVVSIDGAIDARGGSDSPEMAGPGGYAGDDGGQGGGGPGGGGSHARIDIGGGGAGHFLGGGAGGDRGSSGGGSGGDAYGTADLIPLRGGSGGGAGGGSGGGEGGGGGGAVQISAARIAVGPAGGIHCGGGGGRGGGSDSGGGGGGSGGAILLEALEIRVDGRLTTNGGGGGAGADGSSRGRSGQTGRQRSSAAQGGTASGEGAAGGHGGFTGSPAGQPGQSTTGSASSDNAGGGGGAGGRIVLRTPNLTLTGTLSPSEGVERMPLR